jgi:hypothetical protein
LIDPAGAFEINALQQIARIRGGQSALDDYVEAQLAAPFTNQKLLVGECDCRKPRQGHDLLRIQVFDIAMDLLKLSGV